MEYPAFEPSPMMVYPSNNSGNIMSGIVFLIIVAGIGVGIWYYWKHHKKSKTPPGPTPTSSGHPCKVKDNDVVLDTSTSCDINNYNCVSNINDCQISCQNDTLTIAPYYDVSNPTYEQGSGKSCTLTCQAINTPCTYNYAQPNDSFVCFQNTCQYTQGVTCDTTNAEFIRPDVYKAIPCNKTSPNCSSLQKNSHISDYYCQYQLPSTIDSSEDRVCIKPITPKLKPLDNEVPCSGEVLLNDTLFCSSTTKPNYAPNYNYSATIPSWYNKNQTWYINSIVDKNLLDPSSTYPNSSTDKLDTYGCPTECSDNQCQLNTPKGVPVTINPTPQSNYCDSSNTNMCKPGSYCKPQALPKESFAYYMEPFESKPNPSPCLNSTKKLTPGCYPLSAHTNITDYVCDLGCNTFNNVDMYQSSCTYRPHLPNTTDETILQQLAFCQHKTNNDKCPTGCTGFLSDECQQCDNYTCEFGIDSNCYRLASCENNTCNFSNN